MNLGNDMYFVYDGECPICTLGASIYALRENIGELYTIDARTERDHPVMQEINNAQLNVDDGMVIKYDNQLYQGKEALRLMAELGAPEGLINQLSNSLFRYQAIANMCYPFMKAGRNVALRLKGVGKIENLKAKQ